MVFGTLVAIPAVLIAIVAVAIATDALSQAGVIGSLTGRSAKSILPFYNLATTLAFYGALLAVVLFFAGRHGGHLWRQLGVRRPPYWVLPLMPVLAVALQFLTGLISEALSPLLHGMTNPQGCSISQGFGQDAYLGVIAIVVIAPVVEELTFRGFIFGGLRGKLGTTGAVVVSSVIFALAHTLSVGGSILLLGPSLFVAGVALALVYERTRSIYPGMALHASFNLVAVILIFMSSTAANCH